MATDREVARQRARDNYDERSGTVTKSLRLNGEDLKWFEEQCNSQKLSRAEMFAEMVRKYKKHP